MFTFSLMTDQPCYLVVNKSVVIFIFSRVTDQPCCLLVVNKSRLKKCRKTATKKVRYGNTNTRVRCINSLLNLNTVLTTQPVKLTHDIFQIIEQKNVGGRRSAVRSASLFSNSLEAFQGAREEEPLSATTN